MNCDSQKKADNDVAGNNHNGGCVGYCVAGYSPMLLSPIVLSPIFALSSLLYFVGTTGSIAGASSIGGEHNNTRNNTINVNRTAIVGIFRRRAVLLLAGRSCDVPSRERV